MRRMASRSAQRCCPCMKNGHCIRCKCAKDGKMCIDCWPSTRSRCENSKDPSNSTSAIRNTPTNVSKMTGALYNSSNSSDFGDNSQASNPALISLKNSLHQPIKILRRIPQGSRVCAVRKLCHIIEQVNNQNDIPAWCRLLQFTKRCL